VAAAPTNAPTQDVAQRTQHLKERIDSVEAGRMLRVGGLVLAEALTTGAPVYMSADGVLPDWA